MSQDADTPEPFARDAALADAIRHAIEWRALVPRTVTLRVEGGIATLEGYVRWGFQRSAARHAAKALAGVAWVDDAIVVASTVHASHVRHLVEAAMASRAASETATIRVSFHGGRVTLTGSAPSQEAVADAAFAAWGVPDVNEVVADVRLPRERRDIPRGEPRSS